MYSFHKVTLNHSSFVEERSITDIPLLRTLNKGFEVIKMPTAIDWGNIGNHFSIYKFFWYKMICLLMDIIIQLCNFIDLQ